MTPSASSATTGCARTSPSGSRPARSRPASSPASSAGLGVLGMHLEGYGCAGTSAVAYGLACMELEAVDSGIRSLVSVQGSLAMFAIWQLGQRGAEAAVAAGDGAGEKIGCFGLTEPDFGSNPSGMRTTAKRDGTDWVLNGTKMWITNGAVADVAVVWAQTDDGIRGLRRPDRRTRLQRTRHQEQAQPARLDHQRARPRGRPAARSRRSSPRSPVSRDLCRACPRPASASSSASSEPPATAWRRRSTTRSTGNSSTGRSRGSS